jgi:hypothetical protein
LDDNDVRKEVSDVMKKWALKEEEVLVRELGKTFLTNSRLFSIAKNTIHGIGN